MNTQIDVPRLTAFALGELDGDEQREMEALVAASAEARETIEDIRRTAALLETELAKEPVATLGKAARERIEARILAARIRRWSGYAAAACFVLLVSGIAASVMSPALNQTRETVHVEKPGTDLPVIEDSKRIVLAPTKPRQTLVERWLENRTNTNVKEKLAAPAPPSASVEVSNMVINAPVATLSKKGTDIFGLGVSADHEEDQVTYLDVRPSPATADASKNHKLKFGGGGNLFENDTVNSARRGLERDANKDGIVDFDDIREYRGRSPVMPENTGESYDNVVDNPFFAVLQSPLSTISIDVDTASYANIRRFLNSNSLPPPSAVRIEEMVNYFSYDYPQPEEDQPFSVNIETASCPWKAEHRLIRVGLKGRLVPQEKRPQCNLVFLIDVSGSMNEPNKLPLVKQGLAMLVQRLSPEDRVAMVVYAGQSGLALPSTSVSQKQTILDTIDHLEAGGSTNGGEGIQLAYKIAGEHLNKEGVNRVILATDGDFNVGVTNQNDLVKLVEEKARGGVFLSVLGFGMGNLKDATLEKLADKGNGNYAYIDTFAEAKKVLVDQMAGTLVTIAKDVKIQIEFNPAQVAAYRLIGYENRILAAADFNNDKKDAGEIGAGHTVTALYEIVPTSASTVGVDALKYQTVENTPKPRPDSDELLTLKLRYKQPDGQTSKLIQSPVKDSQRSFDESSDDLRFAAAVPASAWLCNSRKRPLPTTQCSTCDGSRGKDTSGYRAEFIDLVRKAKTLSGQ
jgi:Ca-activated chloride channel family protein